MDLRQYKNELYKKQVMLKGKSFMVDRDYEKARRISELKNEYYKKWYFINEYLKEREKIK